MIRPNGCKLEEDEFFTGCANCSVTIKIRDILARFRPIRDWRTGPLIDELGKATGKARKKSNLNTCPYASSTILIALADVWEREDINYLKPEIAKINEGVS